MPGEEFDLGSYADTIGNSGGGGGGFGGFGDLFKGMDWSKILSGVGDVGGIAGTGFGLLQQAMGPGQNRAPRLDRGGFGTGIGPSPNAKQAAGISKDMQAQGVPEGAVSGDFYKNYLPPEFANLPPEVIQQLISQGNNQGQQQQASPLGGA